MNCHMIIGYIGRIKISDKAVTMSVATNESKKDENGQWDTETDWHSVSVLYPSLVAKAKRLEKGDRVFVRGRHKMSKYIDKDGVERPASQIIADKIEVQCKKNQTNLVDQVEQIGDEDDPF